MRFLEKLEHRIEDGLQNLFSDLEANPEYDLPPEAIEDRKFNIRTREYKGRNIKFVSIESGIQYTQGRNKEDILPNGWLDQVSLAMDGVDIAFVEYLPDELRDTGYSERVTGKAYAALGKKMIDPIYKPIADKAREKGLTLAVADIGNRRAYAYYDYNPVDRFSHYFGYSARSVTPTESERYIPSAVDVRRMFTALGMAKTIEEQVPVGGTVMYIAAPSHVNRVDNYLTKKPKLLDQVRRLLYENTVFGVDPRTRIYKHDGSNWILQPSELYYTPGKQLKPVAMTAGVAVALSWGAHAWNKRHKKQ